MPFVRSAGVSSSTLILFPPLHVWNSSVKIIGAGICVSLVCRATPAASLSALYSILLNAFSERGSPLFRLSLV